MLTGILILGGLMFLLQPEAGSESAGQPKSKKIVLKATKLNKERFFKLLEHINEIAVEKHKTLKEWTLLRRRAHRTEEEYRAVLARYLKEEKEIMVSAIQQALEETNVTPQLYNEFLKLHAGEKEAISIRQQLRKDLSTAREPPMQLSRETIVEILQLRIELLEKAQPSSDPLENAVSLARVEDAVFAQFRYEEEQVAAAAELYSGPVEELWKEATRLQQDISV